MQNAMVRHESPGWCTVPSAVAEINQCVSVYLKALHVNDAMKLQRFLHVIQLPLCKQTQHLLVHS